MLNLKTFRKQKGISQEELETKLHSRCTWKAAAIILAAVAVVSILKVVFFSGPNSDSGRADLAADAHLLSVNVKVIDTAEDSGNLFWVEATEDYGSTISQGDTILVTSDSDEITSILEAYQDSNSFRIYFPLINETSNEISVTCYDVIQFNSAGEIIRQKDGGK